MKGLTIQTFDVVIVGAGGAGMRAALQLAQSGYEVALVSKVFPTRSHTVSAQGGITAALANVSSDDWRWHMYDTVKGSDYLGDQDAIEYMCQMGPQVVYELEHMGLPFSRLDNGKIYQRAFGGQTKQYGGEQAIRTCAAADRTGHALLHTLYQQNIKMATHIYSEWYALDLVHAGGGIAGVIVLSIATGEVVFFRAKAVILATGGAGQIYQSTTNALINTGDGMGMALRAGLPLQDMEMWQFHPTGIAGVGVLVTEGCRGEGGYLINRHGERFMTRYAPSAQDLASRDVVARAIAMELLEGRGFDPDGLDYVQLKLDHLGPEIIKHRLPGIRELAMTFAHVDPIKGPIPVVPTCHYSMGGIPTNIHGQVLRPTANQAIAAIEGLFAVGECACVSVHGANRLGGNSLLDLVVFGRATGDYLKEVLQHGLAWRPYSEDDLEQALARYHRWQDNQRGEDYVTIRVEMQQIMQRDFGVFRTQANMERGLKLLLTLQERLAHAVLPDKSQIFNTARLAALELDNLMAVALATAHSALARQESRGAHSREDYPKRDDGHWLKHSLYQQHNHQLSYRPVHMQPKNHEPFQPKERVY